MARLVTFISSILFAALVGNAAAVTASFAITDSWSTGYNGLITVTNDGPAITNGWTLEFDFTGTITNTWNGSVLSKVGNRYTIQNASYNANVASGGSFTVGFSANPANQAQPPTNYVLNGVGVGGTVAITTSSLPGGTVGSAYSQTLAVTGGSGPFAWSVSVGTLPSGLTLSSAGLLSGTPLVTSSGSFTVQVNDSSVPVKTATKVFSLAVSQPPAISINDVSVAINPSTSGSGYLSTRGSQIVDAAGNPVRITGINWFGFETSNRVFHGLWTRNYKSALDQIKSLGFNTLRIPFSSAMLRAGATTNSINFAQNPDLQGLTPFQCLDKMVDYCGQIGLRVFLDRHSAKEDGYLDENVWYLAGDPYYTEQRWIDDWVMLATHYAGNPTVIGADLFNEPKRSATWGNSLPLTDWNKAAERCGNAILAVNPRWLIIVEGVERVGNASYWWGGNLIGVATHPVVLNVPNQLVYSIHDYPASVSAQPWFSAGNYPQNLGGVWDTHFGYIFKNNTAPMLLGEFGSKLATQSDQQWMDKLTDYIDGDFDLNGTNDLPAGNKGISWTYWCFNPNSGDTGGIVGDDWTTVNTTKLAVIQASMAPMLGTSAGAGQSAVFNVTLSAASAQTLTVPWSTVAGTATAGVDFTAASGSLTFAAGETSKTITIAILPNPAPTGNKTFSVQLGTPSAATLADSSGLGTLTSAATSWLQWQTGKFSEAELSSPSISGAAADPDRDGIVNLLEYALALEPKNPSTIGLPTVGSMQLSGKTYSTLNFTKPLALTDLTYTVQVSTDLQTWNSGPAWAIRSDDASSDQATFRLVSALSEAPRQFLRLSVMETGAN